MRAKTGATNLLKGRDIRRNNYSLIVEMLLRHEQLEISDISGELNLSKTTVAKLINALVEKQYIIPTEKGASTEEGGKKPQRYCLNAEKSYLIAAMYSVSHHSIECSLYNEEREMKGRMKPGDAGMDGTAGSRNKSPAMGLL